VLGRPDLLEDPRFRDNPSRTIRAGELAVELEQVFASRPTAEWLAKLDAAGVPVGPVYDIPTVYADPHVQARTMMVEVEHPTASRIKNIGIPVKLSETPGAIRLPSPRRSSVNIPTRFWPNLVSGQKRLPSYATRG